MLLFYKWEPFTTRKPLRPPTTGHEPSTLAPQRHVLRHSRHRHTRYNVPQLLPREPHRGDNKEGRTRASPANPECHRPHKVSLHPSARDGRGSRGNRES